MYGIPQHQLNNAAKMQQMTQQNLDRQFERFQMQHQMAVQQHMQMTAMNGLQAQSSQIAKEMKQKSQNIAAKYNSTLQGMENQYNQNVSNINANLVSLVNTNKDLVGKANTIGDECTKLGVQCKNLETQYKAQAEKNENLYKAVHKLASDIDASNKKLVTVAEKCESGSQEVDKLSRAVGGLSLQLHFVSAQEKLMNEGLEKAHAQMASLKKILEMSKEGKAKMIEENKVEIEKLSDHFNNLFSQLGINDEDYSNQK